MCVPEPNQKSANKYRGHYDIVAKSAGSRISNFSFVLWLWPCVSFVALDSSLLWVFFFCNIDHNGVCGLELME